MLAYLSRLVPAEHLEDNSYLFTRRSDARLLLLTDAASDWSGHADGDPVFVNALILNSLRNYLRVNSPGGNFIDSSLSSA